jgi:hypothetical protein
VPGPEPTPPRQYTVDFTNEAGEVRRRVVTEEEARVLAAQNYPVDELTPEGAAAFQEELRREGARQETADEGGAAALQGFVDELYLGIPSMVVRDHADPDAALRWEARRESSPLLHAAGQIGGAVAPAMLSEGGSLGARLTVAGAAQTLGHLAERELVPMLVQRGLSPALARGVGVAGNAAVDGLASGLAATITQHNITGSPLEAEQFMANGLFGLAAGIGVGVPAGGLSAVGRRARTATVMNAAEQLGEVSNDLDNFSPFDSRLGLPSDDVPRANANFVSRASSVMSNVPEDLIGTLAANARHAADQVGYNNAVTAAARDLEDALHVSNTIGREVTDGGARIASARPWLSAVDDGAVGSTFQTVRNRLREAVRPGTRRVGPDVPAYIANNSERAQANRLIQMLEANRGGTPGGNPELSLTAADQLLDHISETGLLDGAPNLELASAVGAIRSAIGGSLGEAGPRLIATHDALNLSRTAQRNFRNFTRRNSVDGRVRINDGVLSASMRNNENAVRPRAQTREDLNQMLVAQHRVLDQAEMQGVDVTAGRAALDRAAGRLHQTQKWGRVMEARAAAEVAEARGGGLQAAGGISGRGIAIGAGAGIGTMLGGPVGTVLGGALGLLGGSAWAMLSHPTSTLTRFGGLVRGISTTRTAVTEGVSGLRKALEAGRLGTAKVIRQVPRTIAAMRNGKSGKEEYRVATERLRDLQSNPDLLVDRVGRVSGGFEDLHPGYGDVIATNMVQGVNYLVSNLPPASQPSPFQQLQRLEPSRFEMDAFIRRFHAIEDPLIILELAQQGRLTTEHVEAVHAVYPQLLAAIQQEVTAMVADLTTLPSYSQRVQIGTMLQIPVDPTLEPGFIHALQQNYAQTTAQSQTQGQPRRTSVSTSVATDTFSSSQSLELSLQ